VSCQKERALLQSYVDGELDELHVVEIERHLERCAECRLEYYSQRTLRSSLKDPSLYHHAPDGFKEHIRLALQQKVRDPDHSK
jgi:anti-sigma factor RsiW